MFGLSLLNLYFLINYIYTLVCFFLLHGSLAEKMNDRYYEETKKNLTSAEIKAALNMYYVATILFGTFSLLIQIRALLTYPKECLWLYRYYKNKESKD